MHRGCSDALRVVHDDIPPYLKAQQATLSSSLWAMTAMEDLALRSGFFLKLCASAAPLPTSSRSTRYRASYEFYAMVRGRLGRSKGSSLHQVRVGLRVRSCLVEQG